MQPTQNLPLCRGLEVHQDVAAADEIETRKGGIVDQFLSAEYHTGAKIRPDLEQLIVANPFEESTQPISRYLIGYTGRIPTAAGERDGFFARVRGEHLQHATVLSGICSTTP